MAPDPHEPHGSTPAELIALNAAARAGTPYVTWRDGDGALRIEHLDRGLPRVTIGRASSSSISLPSDGAASKLHAELLPIDDEWLIVDDGLSKNGTYVDGTRVDGRMRLKHEGRILVGRTLLVFHVAGGDPLAADDSTHLAGPSLRRSDLSDNEFNVLRELSRPLALRTGGEPTPTKEIAELVHLSVDGVKRCLTRLYGYFEIDESTRRKRELLVDGALQAGIVSRHDYS